VYIKWCYHRQKTFHSSHNASQSISKQSSAEAQQVFKCSSLESLPKHAICPEEPGSPSDVSISHLTKIREVSE